MHLPVSGLRIRRAILGIFLLIFIGDLSAAEPVYIKVHFLYGSKPGRDFRETESRWFGGIPGGHVGIEVDSNVIMDFTMHGKFHVIAKNKKPHSRFAIHNSQNFWEIFGYPADKVKKATIIIPVSEQQKKELDSIFAAYTTQTPYDYAFIGMRCGAAAYDVLSRIGILPQYSLRKTYFKIFYPKRLRKILLEKAAVHNWVIERQEGSSSRKWERD